MRNATKLFILIELLDLLTTMIGFQLGLVEGNLLYANWQYHRMYLLKLNYTVMGITIMEYLPDNWFLWVPCALAFPPVPWNIWMLANLP